MMEADYQSDDDDNSRFTGAVENESKRERNTNENKTVQADKWIVTTAVNGTVLNMKLDKGAKANLITMKDYNALLNKPQIEKKKVGLKAYNGLMIETQGVCRLQVQNKDLKRTLTFIVVPKGKESLLGDQACEDMGLVKRVLAVSVQGETKAGLSMTHDDKQQNAKEDMSLEYREKQYLGMYDGIGALPFTYSIKLKEIAKPVVHASR